MSQSHSSAPNSVREESAPADQSFVAKLQQAAKLANENCDRATILARTLSAQLREAQSRINQLEAEASRLTDRLWAETETALAKFHADANARIERTKQEADARVALVEGEMNIRVRHLEGQLGQAQQLTQQAQADAQLTLDRMARVEVEAEERLSRAWAESEDRFVRLKADLAQAELRAGRAEQWLAVIRGEIEDHLMPSLAAMHDQPIVGGSEINRQLYEEERD
jgi:hypothetical protein